MINIATVLRALPSLMPITTDAQAVVKLVDEIVSTFQDTDRATIREAIDDLAAENDAGHARYQAKLAEAAKH